MKPRDLEMLLASCIHDMKNSISMILSSADQLNETDQSAEQTDEQLANLRYEASRLNNDLMHLLGVYRINERELPIIIDEHEVHEVLQEQFLRNEVLLNKSNMAFELDCDEDEIWYFDSELIGGVINNILVNAVRYSKQRIRLKARVIDDQLSIEVSDDGCGYPDTMLHTPDKPQKAINYRTGSTSLGLYFAAKVAGLHTKNKQAGHITLQNGGDLGGGIFTLYLP
ncbi:MAG: ATP-binding protein [Bermanella sp.]